MNNKPTAYQPGVRVGRWVVVGPTEAPSHVYGKPRPYVICKCDCGTEKPVLRESLKVSRSCGCLKAERASEFHTTHGTRDHPLYCTWDCMLARCRNPKMRQYKDYGGRGIGVCEEWTNFVNFFEWAQGKWATGLTIDRIDNDGNYEPSNCRFITRKEQNRNTRRNVKFEFAGELRTLAEISEITRVRYASLRWRLRKGWSMERATHA